MTPSDIVRQLDLDRINARVRPTDLLAYGPIPAFAGRPPQ